MEAFTYKGISDGKYVDGDIEALNISERLENINNIFEVTSRPLIMDIDTGGKIEHLKLNIRSLERLGISAVIMEDKKGLKKNSLFGNSVKQEQENIKDQIRSSINRYEPRARVLNILVNENPDANTLKVFVTFRVLSTGEVVELETNVSRLR